MKSLLASLVSMAALVSGIVLMALSTVWTDWGREKLIDPTEAEQYIEAVGKMHGMSATPEEYQEARRVTTTVKTKRDTLFALREVQAQRLRWWGIGLAVFGTLIYYFSRSREETG